MNSEHAPRFPGIAIVLGWQDDDNGGGFWLYNLERPLGVHPVGSTVTEATIRRWLAGAAPNRTIPAGCDATPGQS